MFNFDWLSGVSQETAKMIFLSLYALIGLLVLLLPNEYIYEGIAKEESPLVEQFKTMVNCRAIHIGIDL